LKLTSCSTFLQSEHLCADKNTNFVRPKFLYLRPYLFYLWTILIFYGHFTLFICGGMSRNRKKQDLPRIKSRSASQLLNNMYLCLFAKLWFIKNLFLNTHGADAINISGLLNPKKLGNFNNLMLKFFLVV